DIEMGHRNNPNGSSAFAMDVDSLRKDVHSVDKLLACIFESNEDIKGANSANAMKEMRGKLMGHLDDLHRLAKQMEKKFDALVLTNAAQRRAGSADDQNRAAMILHLEDDLGEVMRNFQGLRAQMEADHRQVIETRYFTISGEKATADAIDRIIASEVAASPLHEALEEQGRGPVMEVVAEIEERRDTMMEMRRRLISVHQVLLGIARPVAVEATTTQPPPLPLRLQSNHHEAAPPLQMHLRNNNNNNNNNNVKVGGLNDYERETRKQAYIAIVIALVVNVCIVVALLNSERSLEN
ncbi:hypothetical protein M569_06460, partial [Genlisea aurea]